MNPSVSVVVPTFNRANTVSRTLDSLHAQTSDAWEVILIDDGSTDSTQEVLEQAADGVRVRWAPRDADRRKGANACRNQGAALARGNYLIFLDSDDVLTPACIEQRVAACQEAPGHALWVFDSEVRKRGKATVFNRDPEQRTEANYLAMFLTDAIPWLIMSPLWERDAFLKLGGFDEGIQRHQDAELHIHALAAGLKVARITGASDNAWLLGDEHAKRGFDYQKRKLTDTFSFLQRTADHLKSAGVYQDMLPHWRYFWFRIYKDNFCFHPKALAKEARTFMALSVELNVFEARHKRALKRTFWLIQFRMKTDRRWLVPLEHRAARTFAKNLDHGS